MRTKAQQSEFIKRSISIYKGQVTRAAEEEARQKRDLSLNYDLNEFRLFLTQELGTAICEYCHSKLTVKSFVCDHREAISREGVFTLENIAVCCKSCNWQKGKMNAGEFILMRGLIYDNLPAEIAADFMEQRRVVKKRAAQLHILGSRGRVLTRFNCDFPTAHIRFSNSLSLSESPGRCLIKDYAFTGFKPDRGRHPPVGRHTE